MKKLTKAQLVLFIASSISVIFDFIIDNSDILGISSKVIVGVTLLKTLYDLYNSYSEGEVKEFGEYVANKPLQKLTSINEIDYLFEDWKGDKQ